MAGERRAYNANAIIRNPAWRKKDQYGVLKINPLDAQSYDVQNGEWVNCISETGTVQLPTWITDEVPQGVLSMPHGYGFNYPGEDEQRKGAIVNWLTATHDCDPLAKTPYHKNVRVKIEKINHG